MFDLILNDFGGVGKVGIEHWLECLVDELHLVLGLVFLLDYDTIRQVVQNNILLFAEICDFFLLQEINDRILLIMIKNKWWEQDEENAKLAIVFDDTLEIAALVQGYEYRHHVE